jgi:drug/metabolite transporter (DMT)-like permease
MKASLIKLHVAVFLWGFTGVLGRLISLNEGLLVWYRLLLTILVLFVLMYFKGELQRLNFKRTLQLFGVGIIVALHWCCFYGSIKYSNVSIALTCLSAAGFFTALMEPLFMRRKINPFEVLLGMIGIAGIYLIFHFDPRYQTGIVIGIIATLLSVLFSILNKKMVHDVSSKSMMLYELSGGLLAITLLMPFYLHLFPAKQLLPTASDWGWLVLLSTFCTVLAMDLSLQALQKVSAFTQNLTLNLEPVYGIVLAFAVYHENKYLSGSFYIGVGLIFFSVALQMIRVVKYKKI